MRFCQQCGHQANISDKMCTNCGHKLPEVQQQNAEPATHEIQKQHAFQPAQEIQEQTQTQSQQEKQQRSQQPPPKEKKPLSKKQITIFSIIGALVVIIAGLSIWAPTYFSKDSTEDRFEQALKDKDKAKLKGLLAHEDGSELKEGEVTAFIDLANEIGNSDIDDFISIEKEGKFLGIFQTYKAFVVDQYAYYDVSNDGLIMTFNDVEPKIDEEDDGVVYGPLAPGIYTVKVELDNDFGKSNTEVEITLSDLDSNEVFMGELPITETIVNVTNYDEEWMADSHLLVNGEKFAITDGESETIGPMFMDGSTEAQVVVNYPWGEVASEPFKIDYDYYQATAPILTNEQYENMASTVVEFGEQLANARASLTTDVFTNASQSFINDFQEYEINYLIDNGFLYSGMLHSVVIDRDSIGFDGDYLVVLASFNYDQDTYAMLETPQFEYYNIPVGLGLVYNKESENWTIGYLEYLNSVTGTDSFNGSQTLYEPSEEAVQASLTAPLQDEIQDFMQAYNYASVEAMNWRDISYVESFLTSDGPRLQEAIDYIAYIEEQGIFEEYISSEVTNVEAKQNGVYEVTTTDTFTIIRPDSNETKSFTTVTELLNIDGYWYINKLISTKEI